MVNNTGNHQRITTLWPAVQDAQGNPINAKDEVDAIGSGYKKLREEVRLPPNQGLPFSFRVDLLGDVCIEDNYEFIIEAEPTESGRDDLALLNHDLDLSDWPADFTVRGAFENPGPDLSESVAIVVTLYDPEERVIGVSWWRETELDFLAAGTHDFRVEGEMWPVADPLELTVDTYEVTILGH